MTSTIIVLPGIGGSGPNHWQTHWEMQNSAMRRFQPSSWDQPDLEDWIAALDNAVSETEEPPLLIAHSLACLLVAHWAARSARQVCGAFLVSVPDPLCAIFPSEAATFSDPPELPLPFPSLIVASDNDPYGSLEYAKQRAQQWNGGLVIAGALGHINGNSGIGNWPQGTMLLEAFQAGTKKQAMTVK